MAPADQSSLEGRKRRRGLAIVLGTIMHLLYSTRRSGRMIWRPSPTLKQTMTAWPQR